jgi:DNA-binding winged helix-turn-helix (wHTH) protein/tetratricopeptide (TPR) repeat protein
MCDIPWRRIVLPVSKLAYRFADFVLVPGENQLMRDGRPVTLPPKLFDALVLLVENAGHLVDKQTLMDRLWPGTFVQEDSLAQTISQLRKRLHGSKAEQAELIETVPKRGYRFVGRLCEIESPDKARLEAEVHHYQGAKRIALAVLPFEIIGAHSEQEYLADGLTEEMIVSLGQIDPEHLAVIGRTSVMAYKRTNKSLAEIGRETGAAFLVESSIRSENSRLRISSKLIQVSDQAQIWSASYDIHPGSMLEFQRDLSATIAKQIQVRLSPERIAALERRQTRHLQAYDFYLRGRYFWNQLSPRTSHIALQYYTRATEVDPHYALAWSGVADAQSTSGINSDVRPATARDHARDAVAHALAAEPDLAETQTSLGIVKFWFDWDWPGAEAALRNAIELDSSYPLAQRMLGITLSHTGNHEEAKPFMRKARELDPLHASHHALSAQVVFNARDYPEAVRFARQATILDPEFWIGYMQLGQAYERLDQTELALENFNIATRLCGNSKPLSCRGYVLARTGRIQAAREVLDTLEAIARERYVPPYAPALVYLGLGQLDDALTSIERAYEARDVHLVFLPVDAKWDVVRDHPRFQAILGRCGFRKTRFMSSEQGTPKESQT